MNRQAICGNIIATGAERPTEKPLFIVATQCIEVGADYDFDALVTEAAPIDSLIQRFGRLNRAGRPIHSPGHIVMRGDRVKEDIALLQDQGANKFIDPIYANAMSFTWNWLTKLNTTNGLDFKIVKMRADVASLDEANRSRMTSSQTHAPVLLPSHVDLLCQTSTTPWPDPDVSLWLHGPQRSDPEVQVCWRSDLYESNPVDVDKGVWAIRLNPYLANDKVHAAVQNVSLCPPTARECLSIPMRRVIAWLKSKSEHERTELDVSSDVPELVDDSEVESLTIPLLFRPVAWRGLAKSKIIDNPQDIRPGDTLVFPAVAGGWADLGFIPALNLLAPSNGPKCADEKSIGSSTGNEWSTTELEIFCSVDRASESYESTCNRSIARLHPSLVDRKTFAPLFERLRSPGDEFRLTKSECLEWIRRLPINVWEQTKASEIQIEYYANRAGIVVKGPKLVSRRPIAIPDDDGSDLYSKIQFGKPIELQDHTGRVRDQVRQMLRNLPLAAYGEMLLRAAEVHDWGKADPRFQAMLMGGDLYAAIWENRLFAKSSRVPNNAQETQFIKMKSELPDEFRHEMLSVSMIEASTHPDIDESQYGLMLHLVASHHGHARPWAPVCVDSNPPDVELKGISSLSLTAERRATIQYHQADSGISERFWSETQRLGWWGLTLLESVLRMSDRRASQLESQPPQ